MKNNNSTDILKRTIKILIISKKNIIRKFIFFLIEVCIALITSFERETITKVGEMIGLLNGVIIALIAVVFTGYAFFQALISDKLLTYLIKDSTANRSKLEESNHYFAQVMMLHLICIMINVMTIIMTIILPEDWALFSEQWINIFLSSSYILFILYLNVEAIWETKSFIFNVFQLFNAHAVSRITEILDKEKRDN